MPTFVGPVMLKIREDRAEGLIRAFIAMTDHSCQVEISTLSIVSAEDSKETFEEWKSVCKNIVTRFIKDTSDHTVVRMDESKPHESN